jgi:1-acyl-sn-glycerol-3-phosphate acyltransferase
VGNKIIIYPEGTRIANGQLGEFKTSGAALAKQAQVPVLPVSHNSGNHWKRGQFLKTPGTIHLQIGPTIDSDLLSTREITESARNWIAESLKKPTDSQY